MDKLKLERLRDLFKQLELIEAEIEEMISGGVQAEPVITTAEKGKGHKPEKNHPWMSGQARGRKKKIRNYICNECGHPFTTNLPPSLARCLDCRSKNVREGEINGEVVEDTNLS